MRAFSTAAPLVIRWLAHPHSNLAERTRHPKNKAPRFFQIAPYACPPKLLNNNIISDKIMLDWMVKINCDRPGDKRSQLKLKFYNSR